MSAGTARETTSQNEKQEAERTGVDVTFTSSKLHPSDKLPPARPHLLNLPKPHHHLGTNYSNIHDYGGHFIQTTSGPNPLVTTLEATLHTHRGDKITVNRVGAVQWTGVGAEHPGSW